MSTFSILDLIFQQKTPKKINLNARNWFIFFVCVCACVPFCPFQLNWFFIYLIICFFFVSGFLNNSMNLWSNTKRNAHTYRLCMCVCLDFVFFFGNKIWQCNFIQIANQFRWNSMNQTAKFVFLFELTWKHLNFSVNFHYLCFNDMTGNYRLVHTLSLFTIKTSQNEKCKKKNVK